MTSKEFELIKEMLQMQKKLDEAIMEELDNRYKNKLMS